jgi:hypothetical protein
MDYHLAIRMSGTHAAVLTRFTRAFWHVAKPPGWISEINAGKRVDPAAETRDQPPLRAASASSTQIPAICGLTLIGDFDGTTASRS